jgi:hypothetical protein
MSRNCQQATARARLDWFVKVTIPAIAANFVVILLQVLVVVAHFYSSDSCPAWFAPIADFRCQIAD